MILCQQSNDTPVEHRRRKRLDVLEDLLLRRQRREYLNTSGEHHKSPRRSQRPTGLFHRRDHGKRLLVDSWQACGNCA
jgi:hypothetical protein